MILIVSNSLNMIEREKITEWIDRYNTGDLRENDHQKFTDMLHRHPVLKAEVRLDKELNAMMEDEDILDLINKLVQVRTKSKNTDLGLKYSLLAASFLALLTTGVYILFFLRHYEPDFSQSVGKEKPYSEHSIMPRTMLPFLDLSKSSKNYTPLARREEMRSRRLIARYQPLPELELLIGAAVRADNIRVSSPKPRLNLPSSSTVLYEWDNLPDNCSLSLEISDNQGKVLMTFYPLTGKRFLLTTSSFGKGLVYWKLIRDEEIVSMGSIILM